MAVSPPSKDSHQTAKAIKKRQVPAYCPMLAGVQVIEKSGVVFEEKNVIIMSDMPIMLLVEAMPDMSCPAEAVEDAMAIEDVAVAMSMPDMSVIDIVALLVRYLTLNIEGLGFRP
ncbi:hypothetical protein LTR95_017943 [Oleoguttula sp. CCFEE 5521]